MVRNRRMQDLIRVCTVCHIFSKVAVKSLPVHHHSARYILFPLVENQYLKPALWGVCSLANYGVAYEETQSNRLRF